MKKLFIWKSLNVNSPQTLAKFYLKYVLEIHFDLVDEVQVFLAVIYLKCLLFSVPLGSFILLVTSICLGKYCHYPIRVKHYREKGLNNRISLSQ